MRFRIYDSDVYTEYIVRAFQTMKKCPRTIDKPLLFFGLEPEDVGILALTSGGSNVIFRYLLCRAYIFRRVDIFKDIKERKASRVYYALSLQPWLKDKGVNRSAG